MRTSRLPPRTITHALSGADKSLETTPTLLAGCPVALSLSILTLPRTESPLNVTSVAPVSSSPRITGRRPGDALVSARPDDYSGEATVSVTVR